jgi:thiamine transport system ATP-binding protein
MLTLESVVIAYPDFRLEASFVVPKGAEVAIVGPSGAGKSTLLAAIAGFESVASGQVLWQGHAITQSRPAARPFSMLFQDNNLFPHLTVFENVALGANPGLRLSETERAAVHSVLAKVGLAEFAARRPAALSGGQQGRVAIARVLLQRRALILLDEPFAALGPALRGEMLDLVRQVARETGASVMLVTHDVAEAARLPMMILVADGRAAPPQDSAELLTNPPPALRAWMG